MNTEQWKPIKGFEGYYDISNHGRVKSLSRSVKTKFGSRTTKEKMLKNIKQQYEVVNLQKKGLMYKSYVHRLVLETFKPNTENKPCANHIDGNKYNNHIDNLEWVTYQENCQHAMDTGLNRKGEQHHASKLTWEKVDNIREELTNGTKTKAKLAREYGVTFACIWKVEHNQSWVR